MSTKSGSLICLRTCVYIIHAYSNGEASTVVSASLPCHLSSAALAPPEREVTSRTTMESSLENILDLIPYVHVCASEYFYYCVAICRQSEIRGETQV